VRFPAFGFMSSVRNGGDAEGLSHTLLWMKDPVDPELHVMGDLVPQRDPHRTFTRTEVRRAWERQGHACMLCRRAIPFDLMHGDHIIPWSVGGPTTFDNLRPCAVLVIYARARPRSESNLYSGVRLGCLYRAFTRSAAGAGSLAGRRS
jgi:HNH endonuclease